MLNKVILIGRIGADPELKYFENGNIITVLKIITNENIKGILQNSWHRVIINKKSTNYTKGMIVMVSGKIKTRRWLTEYKYNYITEIISEEVKIIKMGQYSEGDIVDKENEENINFNSEYLDDNVKDEHYEKELSSEESIKTEEKYDENSDTF